MGRQPGSPAKVIWITSAPQSGLLNGSDETKWRLA